MERCNLESPLGSIHQRDLNELKNLTVHRELAITAAMDYCAEEKICPPRWLVTEAAALICDLLRREKAQKRGRTGGHIARYRQDLWDIERWHAVEDIRQIRKKIKRDAELRRAHGHTPENSRAMYHHERTLKWLRQGTFACASMYLAGRQARVSPEAVRASYRRCKRRSNEGSTPDRYFVFDERFLLKLGFPGFADRAPGTKFPFLYNLPS